MKNKFRKNMYTLAMIVCTATFLISISFIFRSEYLKYRDNKIIEKVQKEKDNEISEEKEDIEDTQIIPKYKGLYEENSNFYGWIEIAGTDINYPVMYTPIEPNFYINRNWNNEASDMGSIYISGNCQPDSENLIIYGHNRKDLKMFGYLSYYKEESFYKEHKYIKFDTLYEEGIYEIIAVSSAFIREEDLMEAEETNKINQVPYKDVDDKEYLFYNHVELDCQEQFEDYVNYIKEHSYYQIDTDAKYGDQLITLCTCTNIKKYQNERLLVVAKKIE